MSSRQARWISADLREAIGREELRDKLLQLGAVPAPTSPEKFSALNDNDRKRYAQIIRERRITAN
ncbi:hypothetical protein JJ685_22690 [Ramlibacter monticola]|uniref:Uncharacterized protein n=1 Tax=Ramlibacter monticola TaxID=1926872 RepID=A0A937CVV5_9BURK|nr:hypothetical protein [Ramlibacter monticola]MBL0393964.1 hypothetical protein [Ramlibacter monticola]